MPEEAFKIHGLSGDFLADKPKFSEIAQSFHDFIKDTVIIAHNASFDVKFLNWELENAGFPRIDNDMVRDTLVMARAEIPLWSQQPSMPFAAALASITPVVRCMALCLIVRSSPMSISSLSAVARPASCWAPPMTTIMTIRGAKKGSANSVRRHDRARPRWRRA